MFNGFMPYALVMVAFVALLGWAAIEDFRTYRIPNRIPVALLALYPLAVMTAPAPIAWPVAVAVSIVVLMVGFMLYLMKTFGAGDTKLLAATSLWIGQDHFMLFMVATVIVTFLLVGVVAYRAALRLETANGGHAGARAAMGAFPTLRFAPFRKLVIPYGVAIAAGAAASAFLRLAAIPA